MFDAPNTDKLCIKCALITSQRLIPSTFGCDWQCSVCNNTLHAFAFKDMVQLVQKHVFKLPDKPALIPIPNIKVFLKSDVPTDVTTDTESELDSRAVKQHVEITGRLPVVGKPMYANRHGLSIPYGEVVRIEEVP